MTTYETFVDDFLVKNGMPVSENILNKAPDQLKKEIDELSILVSSGTGVGTLQDFQTALQG